MPEPPASRRVSILLWRGQAASPPLLSHPSDRHSSDTVYHDPIFGPHTEKFAVQDWLAHPFISETYGDSNYYVQRQRPPRRGRQAAAVAVLLGRVHVVNKPVKRRGRRPKPQPAPASLFEWKLELEQAKEAEQIGSSQETMLESITKGRATNARSIEDLPKLYFVHSGCVGQRFYEAVNYGAREFSDVGLSRRYAENV